MSVQPESRVRSQVGVVLYDGRCGVCSHWAKRAMKMLSRHGFQVASVDDPWVTQKLKQSPDELRAEIRLVTTDGRLISGADVYLHIARQIWWAWPIYAIFSLPGLNRLFHAGYRWFARNRYGVSHVCKLQPR